MGLSCTKIGRHQHHQEQHHQQQQQQQQQHQQWLQPPQQPLLPLSEPSSPISSHIVRTRPPTPTVLSPPPYFLPDNPHTVPDSDSGSDSEFEPFRFDPENPFNYYTPPFQGSRRSNRSNRRNNRSGFVAPYVDHQSARKIKSEVNVHKNTLKIEFDENHLDSLLVSFTFDALVDGSITICYFAKEGSNCTFTPLYPDIYIPMSFPFQKGLGQTFSQPSGTGIALGYFDIYDLWKLSSIEDVFPLVIFAETCLPFPPPIAVAFNQPLPTAFSQAQITQAVLEKNSMGHLQVKVVKQNLWVDGVRYELREIYGIGNSVEAGCNDNEQGNECVICMSEPKAAAVLPCRHMCMCSECAKELRLQSDKCPVCREPIQQLMEIILA